MCGSTIILALLLERSNIIVWPFFVGQKCIIWPLDQSKSPHEKGEDEDYPTDSRDDIERLCKIKGHCKNGQCILDENGQTACLCDEGYEPDRLELICNDVDECQDGSARNDFPL